MNLEEVLTESCVISNLEASNKKDAIYEMCESLKKAGLIENVQEVVNVILEREKLGSTGIGEGIAIPHGKMKGIKSILCVLGKSERGIDFDSIDKKPVHIIVLLLAPEGSASMHLKMLSRISKILRDPSIRNRLLEIKDAREIYSYILEEDRKI
ncbi:MAG TPA: PTS sugar transporter subunit IIA [Syntrophorhabdaceae bacterium]|nr:PTS sugar transporter subunit IIA [Syntrophorhabdaceae bacterium]HPP06123.1 PTS sugar transporter subunit IIA [Syntrophorhabdaceae bacterium]